MGDARVRFGMKTKEILESIIQKEKIIENVTSTFACITVAMALQLFPYRNILLISSTGVHGDVLISAEHILDTYSLISAYAHTHTHVHVQRCVSADDIRATLLTVV